MIEHKILEMNIDTVSFMMINNKETKEILYFYHTVPGVVKLRDIKTQLGNIKFDHVFIPRQKSNFLFQKKLFLNEIKILYRNRNVVCPYDSLNYVLFKILDNDNHKECFVASYDVVENYCKNNEKVELY